MPVTCGMCQDVFDSDIKFTDHFLLVHTADEKAESEEEQALDVVTVNIEDSPKHFDKFNNSGVLESCQFLNLGTIEVDPNQELVKINNTCRICNEHKSSSRQLACHILTHMGTMPYYCVPCAFTCISKLRFQQHVFNHQVDGIKKDPTERSWLFTKSNVHECEICHRTFQAWIDLVFHFENHIIRFQYRCFQCRFYFSEVKDLKIHDHLHGYSKKCDLCGMLFASKNRLLDHVLHHERGKLFRRFHQILWNNGVSRIQNPFSVLRASYLGEGFNEVEFDPEVSRISKGVVKENECDKNVNDNHTDQQLLSDDEEELIVYGSKDVSHLCKVIFKESSDEYIPKSNTDSSKKSIVLQRLQKQGVLVKLQPSKNNLIKTSSDSSEDSDDISSDHLKLKISDSESSKDSDDKYSKDLKLEISGSDSKERSVENPVKTSNLKIPILDGDKSVDSENKISRREITKAKWNGVPNKLNNSLKTYSKSKIVKTKKSFEGIRDNSNSNLNQSKSNCNRVEVIKVKLPQLILEKLPSQVIDFKSYRRYRNQQRKKHMKMHWKKVAEIREKEKKSCPEKSDSDSGLVTRSGKVIKTKFEHVPKKTNVELSEKITQYSNSGLVTRSGRVIKEAEDTANKRLSSGSINSEKLNAEGVMISSSDTEEVNCSSLLMTRSKRMVKVANPALKKMLTKKSAKVFDNSEKTQSIDQQEEISANCSEKSILLHSSTPTKALDSSKELVTSTCDTKIVKKKLNVMKSNSMSKTEHLKETPLINQTSKNRDNFENIDSLSSSDSETFTSADKSNLDSEITDKPNETLVSYICQLINHDHNYQSIKKTEDADTSPLKDNFNKSESNKKTKLFLNKFINRKSNQNNRKVNESNKRVKLAIKNNFRKKNETILTKRKIKLLKSRAKTDILKVKLTRLPECIFEKYLKCKPIMLSNVLPVISKVLSLDPVKRTGVDNETFLNHFTVLPFNLDDHNYCKLNGNANNWPVPDSDSESTLSSHSVPYSEDY